MFSAAGRIARLLLAIDSGLGREGVSPTEAPAIAERINAVPSVELVGIFAHEGTVYGADRTDLELRARHAGDMMVALANLIRERGVPLSIT